MQRVAPPESLRLFDRPYLLLVLAVMFWAGNMIVGRAVRADVPPVALAFLRWTLATLLLAPFAVRRTIADLPVLLRAWRPVLLLAFLGVATFNTLVYLALQSVPSINAFIMQSLMPIFIIGFSFLFFREAIGGAQLSGLLVSLAGALLVVTAGRPLDILARPPQFGDLLLLVAVLSYAAYSALLRLRPRVHPLSFLLATFALGSLMLLPFFVWELRAGQPLVLNRELVLSAGYVAIFPSIVSYLCFNRGVELAGANRAGTFIHLMPLIGSLLAVLLLGEAFRGYHAAGLVLILGGIGLASRRGERSRL